MKTLATFAAVAALAATSYAQMSPLPPSSTTDGVIVQPIGLNAGATHWNSTTSIGAFQPVSNSNGTISLTGVWPTMTFNNAIPSPVQAGLTMLGSTGGTLRTIFLSESAMWLDSLGYTRSGNFAGPQSYTALSMIESRPGSSTPVNTQFGNYFDINFAAGTFGNFDIWFQGEGGTFLGGDYTVFHPANSSPNLAPGNALWAQSAVNANTWIAATSSYQDVMTYIVGLEDWRLDRGSDRDYSDVIIAFQFFNANGTPFTPVPEPATYGLIGAAALLGMVVLRRKFYKKTAAKLAV